MTADLHEKLLAELDAYDAPSVFGASKLLDALRAVVERHVPTTDGTHLPACTGCSTRDDLGGWVSWVAHPCGELQLIADELLGGPWSFHCYRCGTKAAGVTVAAAAAIRAEHSAERCAEAP